MGVQGRPAARSMRWTWAANVFSRKIAGMIYPTRDCSSRPTDAKPHRRDRVLGHTSADPGHCRRRLGHRPHHRHGDGEKDGIITGELGSDIRWGRARQTRSSSSPTRLASTLRCPSPTQWRGGPAVPGAGRLSVRAESGPRTARHCQRAGWPSCTLNTPRSTSIVDVGRSAAAVGMFAGSVAAAAGLAVSTAADPWAPTSQPASAATWCWHQPECVCT